MRSADDTLGNRIRVATELKVPYMLVVGDRDVDAGTVGLRTREGEDRRDVALADFIAEVTAEVAERR